MSELPGARDRVLEILHSNVSQRVMEMTPSGSLEWVIQEQEAKLEALQSLRSKLEYQAAQVSVEMDGVRNVRDEYAQALTKLASA